MRKHLELDIKAKTDKEFEQAIKYALYEIHMGVKDNDISLVDQSGDLSINLKYRVWTDNE